MTLALACGFAILAWWGSTAALVYLDRLPRWTHRYSFGAMTALAAVCLWGIYGTARDTGVAGAYCAFACALVAWGWHEMSFYTGIVTGPRKTACDPAGGLARRFGQAVAAMLWHELAIAAMAVAIVAMTRAGANHVGVWTFLALWAMRQSAKLNVFLGVRNLHAELLPDHLRYLASYFARAVVNPLFPVSVTLASAATAIAASDALAAATPAARAGSAMLATMLALAVAEHWMLVLPIPAMVLRALGIAPPAAARDEAMVDGVSDGAVGRTASGATVVDFADRAARRAAARARAA